MTVFWGILCLIGIMLIVISLIIRRNGKSREWRLLAFLSFFFLPIVFAFGVVSQKMTAMQKTDFCGSCHTMTPYIESLTFDDDEPLSSVHYRNNYVPQEKACYSCHTSYAMFGGVNAKIRGLRHVWTYLTDADKDSIALYEPYSNDNCLHCHGPSERYLKSKDHRKDKNLLENLRLGKESCLSAGCHDLGHYFETEEDDEEEW